MFRKVPPLRIIAPFILTRYLYRKSQVYISLRAALLQRDFKEALFWAYELYRSGFQSEVIEFVLNIFDEYYSGFPRLRRTFQQWYIEWKTAPREQDVFLGSVLKNMCIRPFANLVEEPDFIIVLRRDQIAEHDTQSCCGKPWQYLSEVCKYAVATNGDDDHSNIHVGKHNTENPKTPVGKHNTENPKTPVGKIKEKEEENELIKKFRENWLYFANYSPIWAMRIKKFSPEIKINHDSYSVEFPTEDLEEEFMDKYNYEPDEQPLSIQQGCMGL
jgi:hypothetical protein